MLKVGLTGGIGSGKSTVSSIFKELDVTIIDADIIARDVLTIYPNISLKIKNAFGELFFDHEGKLKRKELGNLIFGNEEKRKTLENIVIPYIKKEIFKKIEEYNISGSRICIIDAPTLIEQGLNKEMDYNILIWIDRNNQISRIRKRDKLNDLEITKRIDSQIPLDIKKEFVDFVIYNNLDLVNTRKQVIEVLKILKALRG
jgi:dephospho-CoA kinase